MSILNVLQAMFGTLIGSPGAMFAIVATVGVLLGWGIISILKMVFPTLF